MEQPIWIRWSIYGETSWLICTSRNWKLSQSQILSKNADTFFKICLLFRCYSHIFAVANQLPGFSNGRLANVKDFFNANIFFKCKLNINVSINDYSFKYVCSILFKTSFLLPHLFCNVDFELIRLIEFQNKTNIEIIGFLLMHFGFSSDSLNIDLWDLLDTDLDLLVGHGLIQIPPINTVFVSKTYSRRIQDISSRRLQVTSSRRVQVFGLTIFRVEMSSRRICKTSLEDEKLLHWR